MLATGAGFDFTGYRRLDADAARREANAGGRAPTNMTTTRTTSTAHPEEFAQLFNTILINVTAFFRDPAAWELLERRRSSRRSSQAKGDERADPRVVSRRAPRARRRTRSRCCSPRRSVTMRSASASRSTPPTSTTRRSPGARHAVYYAEELDASRRSSAKVLRAANTASRSGSDMRRAVIFGRHDLIQDAPISRLDLLICRNTLMYFNAETQARILARFHFALNDRRVPVPGQGRDAAETHDTCSCRRTSSAGLRQGQGHLAIGCAVGRPPGGEEAARSRAVRLRESAFEPRRVAQLVLDFDGHASSLATTTAGTSFGLSPSRHRPPLQDLESPIGRSS